jgi:hypothetical protein
VPASASTNPEAGINLAIFSSRKGLVSRLRNVL